MIVIYDTGGERAKNSPKWQKILSITLHISGTMHLMTVIYGTHLQNDNISRRFCFFSHFFNILIFLDHRGLKGKKRFRMTKHSVCHAPYLRNHTSYDLQLWYTCMFKRIKSSDVFSFCFKILAFLIISLVHMWNEISLANFLIFQNFDFWGF